MHCRIGTLQVLSRRATKFPAKYRVQVLRRPETTIACDVGNCAVRILQPVCGSGQFETQDLVMHATAPHPAKMRFQRRARNAHVRGYLCGLDALARVLPDKQQRLHDIGVPQRLVQTRSLYVDSVRRYQNVGAGRRHAMQHLVQQARGGSAHCVGALNHRAQRYTREGSGQWIVVDADQRHLFRHGNSGSQAGLQQLTGAGIGHGNDADRLGQALQPGDLLFHSAVPERCTGAQAAINLGVQAVALQQSTKGLLALLRRAQRLA
ncbi:hypothetical protein ALP03_01052 [Pseudomonas amygdali pv. tabaci]|uniref:Uncharacterized protein n=1 Tax=Pseudomonas amygdali pv. tabaci TaxID=322 RepID=A0A3M6GZJ4_PSEAJ|nr:hypothetical protein ALP03_01052 [Pseudomonas amygdali pv. tabaci]